MKKIEITFTVEGYHRIHVAPDLHNRRPNPQFVFGQDRGASWKWVEITVAKDHDGHPTDLFGESGSPDHPNWYEVEGSYKVAYPKHAKHTRFEFRPLDENGQPPSTALQPPSVGSVEVP
jgi:hypothetical protein